VTAFCESFSDFQLANVLDSRTRLFSRHGEEALTGFQYFSYVSICQAIRSIELDIFYFLRGTSCNRVIIESTLGVQATLPRIVAPLQSELKFREASFDQSETSSCRKESIGSCRKRSRAKCQKKPWYVVIRSRLDRKHLTAKKDCRSKLPKV
jgi:hypothetical protein